MAFYFIVRDTDEQNPPRNVEEFKRRVDEIREWIPQPQERQRDNNMTFASKAFELFKDCGLISRDNLETLNDKKWCDENIGSVQLASDKACSQINPLGGVVRREDLPMCDKSNLRYYCPRDELKLDSDIEVASKGFGGASKLAVVCEGVTYYISNDWFSDDKIRPTKSAFANRLFIWAFMACDKIWKAESGEVPSTTLTDMRASHVAPTVELEIEPTDELQPDDKVSNVTAGKPDDLAEVIELLKTLHAKVDALTVAIEEIKQTLGGKTHD